MGPVGPVELDEVQLVLATRLRDVTDPPPRRRYGAVFVGTDARRARDGVRRRVRSRARRESVPREDPRGSAAARRRSAVRLGSARAGDRSRSARPPSVWRCGSPSARRAGASACPTRGSTSRRARPRVPSFYALEVLRAAEGRLPSLDGLTRGAEQAAGARLGWPAPGQPSVGHRRGGVRPRAAGAAARCRSRRPPSGRRRISCRPIRIWRGRSGRAAGAGCGAGRRRTASSIRTTLAREALAQHQLDRRAFSPTALQHFAACPYRFFLQAIHRLAPREEPVAIEVLDPLTRGALFHDVQFGVLEGLRDGGLLPLRPAGLERAFDVLDAVLDSEGGQGRREARARHPPRVARRARRPARRPARMAAPSGGRRVRLGPRALRAVLRPSSRRARASRSGERAGGGGGDGSPDPARLHRSGGAARGRRRAASPITRPARCGRRRAWWWAAVGCCSRSSMRWRASAC